MILRHPPCTVLALLLLISPLRADNLLLCGNDQTVTYATNELVFREEPKAGSLTVIDASSLPPRTYSVENVPCSVIGPPTTIVRVPGRPLALSANAMRPEKVDGQWKHVPDNKVTLVRLEGERGIVAGQVQTGLQPSGLSVSPDGATASVVNRADGSLSILSIEDNGLTEKHRIKLCEPGDSVSHIEWSPDGQLGIATLNKADALLILRRNKAGLPEVSQRLSAGQGPYSARFLPDGRRAFVANIVSDSITVLDVSGEKVEELQQIPTGHIPEGLNISPDGKWIAVSCMEGRNLTDKSSPHYGRPATIQLLREDAGRWVVAQKLTVEGGPQFAVFTPDGKYLVLSVTGSKRLDFLQEKDGQFVSTGFQLPVDGEPVAAAR